MNLQVKNELVDPTFADKRKHQLRQFQSRELWKVSHISRLKWYCQRWIHLKRKRNKTIENERRYASGSNKKEKEKQHPLALPNNFLTTGSL